MTIQDSFEIFIEGQTLRLLPEKALFWENEKCLIISDVHLGKAGHFRKNGIALPQSSHDEDLRVIDILIQNWEPKWIIFLGDLFHSGKNVEWQSFKKWRISHSTVEMHLVLGNHEIYPEEEYSILGVNCFHQYLAEPFIFIHDEEMVNASDMIFTISGHIHPAIRMKGIGRQSLRIPCFYIEKSKAFLPAFGSLTGTQTIKLSRKAQVFGVLENQILQIQ